MLSVRILIAVHNHDALRDCPETTDNLGGFIIQVFSLLIRSRLPHRIRIGWYRNTGERQRPESGSVNTTSGN
jgi:hypothetical protein